jgi:SNF2 family DNA or RNA helicase
LFTSKRLLLIFFISFLLRTRSSKINREKEEFDIIEKKAKQFYLSFRAQNASTMSKYFLKVSQKLTPLRVACSGGKYPLENEDKINDHDTDIEDNDSDDEDQKKKKKKPAVKIYSEFAFKSKFRFLLQELESIRDNDVSSKSLVFSQFNSTLEYLQIELPKHGFQFRTLSGSMSMKQRAKALRDFQNDPPTTVFLLSMRAGAVGINLTQANRVFLMEPSFNPALEAQAIGRVQ